MPEELPTPRPFQPIALEALRQGIRAGHQRQILCASTGSGKTIVGLYLIKETLAKGNRALFLCDRKTLIRQTSEVADRYGMDHGIIQAQNPRLALWKPFQIASVQTLQRRGWPAGFHVIIIDEAHTQFKTTKEFIESEDCKAKVIGLSATPFTKGLGKTYSNLVNATTMEKLVEDGILVPLRIFSCRKPDMRGAATSGGEWTDEAAEGKEIPLIGDVVLEYERLTPGKKAIAFGPTIRYCEELVTRFLASGIQAVTFTSETSDTQREWILKNFDGPDSSIRILVSVEALAKGFDVQDIEVVIDARPLRKSFSCFVQMVGRGLRCSVSTGKAGCTLLDFSGNIIRFKDDWSDLYFNGLASLDDGEKLDKSIREDNDKEPPTCPECGYTPMGKRCVGCGYEKPRPALQQHLPGEMQEIILNGKKLAENAFSLYNQIVVYSKFHSAPEKQKGRAAHLFKDITSMWPPKHFHFETAPYEEPTRNTLNKIKSLYIAFQKGRAS